MTKIFFVRHAQSEYFWVDDRTRPLTEEGLRDTKIVLDFFRDRTIDCFYSSPYRRSIQTIESTARYFNKEIITDERLRERENGAVGRNFDMIQKRWADKNYCEAGGESINMVQERNIDALYNIIEGDIDKTIVVGTHGTALGSILNYFDHTFNCESFLRIIDWMPYIIELDLEGKNCVKKIEHLFIQKEWKGNERADK